MRECFPWTPAVDGSSGGLAKARKHRHRPWLAVADWTEGVSIFETGRYKYEIGGGTEDELDGWNAG